MKREETVRLLDASLFGSDDDEIRIVLDQPSIAVTATTGIASVSDGFDWDNGNVLITPDEPLVSWDFLEDYYPGIKDEIEKRVHDRARRPLRVIVAGSRSYGNTPEEVQYIKEKMSLLACPPYVTADRVEIVSGAARGVDSAAALCARELGYAVREFPADWEAYGKAAGMLRNGDMAKYASEDPRKWRGKLLAFWDGKSPGTRNMVNLAREAGLEVTVVDV